MGIRWGHFSDLHFEYGAGFDTRLLRSALLDALKDCGGNLQYLFITGDISHKGKLDGQTTQFIKEIADAAGCAPSHIFICPGNHDGKRCRPRKVLLDDQLMQYQKTKNLDISKDVQNILIDAPFTEFWQACSQLTEGNVPDKSPHFVRKLDHIRLFVLNSAIFAGQTYPEQEDCGKEEQQKEDHNLYLCDSYLFDLLSSAGTAGDDDQTLNIVMMHHGVECLAQAEQIKFKAFLDQLGADLILCGHVHRNINHEVDETAAMVRQVSCGGLFVDGYNEPSFIIGEYTPEDGSIMLENYCYENGQWCVSPKAPKPYKKGLFHYTPSRLKGHLKKTTPEEPPQQPEIPFSPGAFPLYNTQKNIIFVVKATQESNYTPFEDSGERLCGLYPALTKSHLLFLDKLYLSLLPENSYLNEVSNCISTDQIILRHDVYRVFAGKLKELLTSEKDGAMTDTSDHLEDLIQLVAANYPSLSFALTQRLFVQEIQATKFRFGLMKKDILENAPSFIGYEAQQKALAKALTKSGYIYISGDQFFGKTSLIEKMLYDRITTRDPNAFRAPLPWGPEFFIVFGKQASDRGTAMQMLIEQANLVLPNPIKCGDNPSDPYYFESLIHMICDQLERVVIIIDALDEIGMDDLSLFPEELPQNCTVMLSSKRSLSETVFKAKNGMTHIKVTGLSEDDFLKIAGLTHKQKGVAKFVKDTVRRTKGSPYLLNQVAQEIIKAGGTLPKTDEQFLQSLSSPFEKFKACWMENGSADGPLYQILNLLTIFERVDYIKIKDIQSYLKTRNYLLTTEQIRSRLRTVRVQLDSDDQERFKLKYNAFASYLIDQFSPDDLQIIFNRVLGWLFHYEDKFEYLHRFFIMSYTFDSFSQEQALSILQLFIKEDKKKALKTILFFLCDLAVLSQEFNSKMKPGIELCFSCLKEDEEAIKTYFNYLYKQAKDNQAAQNAIQYLKQLADRGNTDVIVQYARLLASGDLYLDADPAQALNYLNAAEHTEDVLWESFDIYQNLGDGAHVKACLDQLLTFQTKQAQDAYAFYLGTGKYYEQDTEKCEEILDRLIRQGYEHALYSKAVLIYKKHLPKYTIDDAYQLFDQLSKTNPYGDYYKGKILIETSKEREKGLKLIRKAEKEGCASAKLYLLHKKTNQKKRLSSSEVAFLINMAKKDYENARGLLQYSIDQNLIDQKAFDINALTEFAINCYSPVSSAISFFQHKDYQTAFALFEQEYQSQNSEVGTNIAYMLRKGFVSSDSYHIDDLLAPGLKENEPFAIINSVLYHLPQLTGREEKRRAILQFDQIPVDHLTFDEAVKWWRDLSAQGDAEGDFVLGLLLYKKKLTADPEGQSMQQRFDRARAGGFDLSFLDLP